MPVVTKPMNQRYHGMIANLHTVRYGQIRFCAFPAIAEERIMIGSPIVKLDPPNPDNPYAVKMCGAGEADKIIGLAYPNFQRPLENVDGYLYYDVGQAVSIIEFGEICLESETPVESNVKVYFRESADGDKTTLGLVSGAAGTGLTELKGARFLETWQAPSIVWVRYNYDLTLVG